MSWSDIKNKLLEASKQIKQSKFLDATVEALLSQIPVVGPFASKYWSIIEGDDATRADAVSKLLEMAAQQEEQYNNLTTILEQQGEVLLQNKASLEDIRDLMSYHFKAIEERIYGLETRMDLMLQHFGIKEVHEASPVSIALEEDRRKAVELVNEVQGVIEKAGKHAFPETYYKQGMIYLALNQFEEAEASFLAALKVNPEMGKAYIALGRIYQLRANVLIRGENFGLADKALEKAERYVKSAWQYDSEDPRVNVQLGYIQKDLAVRYIHARQNQKAQPYLQKAETNFKKAIAVDENNASAYNGMGNIYYLRGDYDSALRYYIKATKLVPKYLFAYYDLALCFYMKAQDFTINEDDRIKALKGLMAAADLVMKLHGTDAGRLPDRVYQDFCKIITWGTQEAERVKKYRAR